MGRKTWFVKAWDVLDLIEKGVFKKLVDDNRNAEIRNFIGTVEATRNELNELAGSVE